MTDIEDSITNAVQNKVEEYVNKLPKELLTYLAYDAGAENVDTSKVKASIEKDGSSGYSLELDLSGVDERCKFLIKETYLPNAMKRRKW